jgi:hypothetical protein
MLPPLRLTMRLNATGSLQDHASAARSAAGRLAKKTSGLAPADMNGTRSTLEAYAQLASISGLKPSAFLAADGRHIRVGMQANPALNEAIAEVRSRYRSLRLTLATTDTSA